MIDLDTFLTTLYVMVDDFYKAHTQPVCSQAGRPNLLQPSEVITLGLLEQWYWFRSQRDFYQYAQRNLQGHFPGLPNRTQYNRQLNQHHELIAAFGRSLGLGADGQSSPYEILDTTGVPCRHVKRRGYGWLGGEAGIGYCTRLGWFHGMRLLISVTRSGLITGYGFGSGNAKEQPMTEVFLGLRAHPDPRLSTVGQPARGGYLADAGFAGQKNQQRWLHWYGATVICQPQTNAPPWPQPWRAWLHRLRQVIEAVFDKLYNFFRMDKDRPHHLAGVRIRFAAKIALHNFCAWLNGHLGRPPLAFADLVDR